MIDPQILQIMPTEWHSVWADVNAAPWFVRYSPLTALAMVHKEGENYVTGVEPNEDGVLDLTDEDDPMFLGYTHGRILESGAEQIPWRNKAKDRIEIEEDENGLEEKTE